MDHDQRFKTMLRAHFADFMQLFFAEWANDMDLSTVEWLDKEVFPDPPEGTRHVVDLVARLVMHESAPEGDSEGITSEEKVVLIHVEIESEDRTTSIKSRLPDYYHALRQEYNLPVLPIVLYLKVGLDGIGIDSCVDRFGTLDVRTFRYLYVGLPALDAVQYLQGESWLGVALSALMQISPDRVAWLGAEALRHLAGAPLSDQQRFLFSDCVQAYLPMTEEQRHEFDDLLKTETYQEIKAVNKTVFDEGLEKGIELGQVKGLERARRESACDLLQVVLGTVPASVQAQLDQMSEKELRLLIPKIPNAESFEELGLNGTGDAN